MVRETIIGDLRKHGFELVSVAHPDLVANDPTRILLRQMTGAVAQVLTRGLLLAGKRIVTLNFGRRKDPVLRFSVPDEFLTKYSPRKEL